MRARNASVLVSLILSAFAASAAAQPAAPDVDEFGTQDGIDLWIPAYEFTAGTASLKDADVGYSYSTGTVATTFNAVLRLPQGAYLDSWRAFYFDGSDSNDITVHLFKNYDDTTASPNPHGEILSTFFSSGTPGFANHHQVEDLTIDLREPYPGSGVTRMQAADFYGFSVDMPGSDPEIQFKGVRVFWHRQVSPAPATATFNDVPTSDPAFQYVEALAASGITAGCNASPPMYCPDATLTRRQMAVFLSKALGLHWPPF